MSISSATLYRILNKVLAHPGNTVCKQTVCQDILKEMELEGEQVTEGFKKIVENLSSPESGNC